MFCCYDGAFSLMVVNLVCLVGFLIGCLCWLVSVGLRMLVVLLIVVLVVCCCCLLFNNLALWVILVGLFADYDVFVVLLLVWLLW